ncbi:hypothetical protein ACFE04_029405 [Oxalis oulophora]
MGSNSSSTDDSSSLNGLILGQKIYFEDVVGPTPTLTSAATLSKSVTPGTSSSKSRKMKASGGGGGGGVVVGGGGQPPRCQVEGCKLDLSDVKAYYSRHKVCAVHSKTAKVIVNGIEQRFCQQCSRFHQLSEFDQGKRSCRRRLAGHNERRRKPPPGSLLASRFGRFSPSMFDDITRPGSFMMDFSAYPRLTGRDTWGNVRSSERVTGNQPTAPPGRTGPQWQSNSQNPNFDLFLQAGTGFSSNTGGITQGECYTGVNNTDSTCALSLLSNQQPWTSRNRSSLGINDLMDDNGSHQQTTHSGGSGTNFNHFTNNATYLGSSLHEMAPDLGLGQISSHQQPVDHGQLPGGGLESSHQRRHLMEFEQSRAYDWSL